jgi:hypothetical protein
MSTESHNSAPAPVHKDVSFEERDVKVSTIYWYLIALGIATVASAVICVYIWKFADSLADSSEPSMPASKQAMGKAYRTMPPEPRLQGIYGHESDPQKDMREKRAADLEANEKLEWVDQSAGIVQIPVKDAMKLIAEKGLPALESPPSSSASVEKKK